jgi:hypothetical protein|tara:strand:- start:24442 stop:24633 length:192 start_codon:yes stop_codon:yes gene_type:complete
MYKRYLDFRITTEHDPSGVHTYFYVLEVQHQLLGIKYWSIVDYSYSLEDLTALNRKLKNKHVR